MRTERVSATHLVVLAGVAIFILAVLLAVNGRVTYRAAIRIGEVQAQTMALLLERHTLQIIGEGHGLLLAAELLLQEAAARGGGPGTVLPGIEAKIAASEHVTAIALFDDRKRLSFFSGTFALANPTFRPIGNETKESGMPITLGTARINPLTGHLVLPLHRALERQGGLTGFGVALVDLGPVAAVYSDPVVDAVTMQVLVDSSGRIAFRLDHGGDSALRARILDQLPALAATAGEEIRGLIPIGGASVAYHGLPGYPLVSVVVVDHGPALAEWRAAFIPRVGGSLLAAGLIVLFTGLAIRQLRSERQAQVALSDINAHLEALVDNRTRSLGEALDEQRRLSAVAERATLAKSRFLTAVGHDLRQPLQAVRLYQQILARRLESNEQSGDTQPILKQMDDALTVAQGLLDSLLEIGRIEAGLVVPACRPVVFAEILDILRGQVCDPRLRVVPGSFVVSADPMFLLRILGNLAGNALRHGGDGAVLVGVRRVAGGGVRILVCDRGTGIPPDKLDLIFEEFFQLDTTVRSRENGLGLGLSIARRLADAAGYQLQVHSTPRGSTFSLEIPAAHIMAWGSAGATGEALEDRPIPQSLAAGLPGQPA